MNGRARWSALAPLRLRPPPVALAVLFSALAGGALVLASGHNPLRAYAEIVEGSLSLSSLPDTLNWATPLVGMTLVAAIPLRGGMVNLGGDGQLVVGGLIGALVPLVLPGPGAFVGAAALLAAALGAGLYASLAAWGETRHGIPMLISSLLLSYPAVGVTSYLARFPLRDVTTGLPQTAMIPTAARLYALSGALNVGSLLVAGVAVAAVVVDRRTVCWIRIAHAGQEPALRRLRRRQARPAGRADDVLRAGRSPGSSARSSCSARSSASSTAPS